MTEPELVSVAAWKDIVGRKRFTRAAAIAPFLLPINDSKPGEGGGNSLTPAEIIRIDDAVQLMQMIKEGALSVVDVVQAYVRR
jgi:hypothetical protein